MVRTPFEVICIDDTHKPAEIPNSMWVKKDCIYTVEKVNRMVPQAGILGFKLKEIQLIGCAPYEFYSAHRFALVNPNGLIEEVEEILKYAPKENTAHSYTEGSDL
jgi:hypothetical protein